MYSSIISLLVMKKSFGQLIPISFSLFLDLKLSFSKILFPISGGLVGLPEKIEIKVKQKIKMNCLRPVNDLFFLLPQYYFQI